MARFILVLCKIQEQERRLCHLNDYTIPLHFLIITDLINLFCLDNTFCNNLSSSPFFQGGGGEEFI